MSGRRFRGSDAEDAMALLESALNEPQSLMLGKADILYDFSYDAKSPWHSFVELD